MNLIRSRRLPDMAATWDYVLVALLLLAVLTSAPSLTFAQEEAVPEWAVGLKALADENGMEFPWNEWDELLKAADDSLTSDTLDRDGDGLFMNTDPNDYNPDVDDDGFTDGYEVNNSADPESKDSCPPLGDVNLDGLSNNLDAILIFNYTLGNVSELAAPENGEIDLDGALNNLDAIVLFNWTLSNISLIPNPALPDRIHLVKQDGSGNFTTIQEAVDAATTGDTVIVYPGTYYENIIMSGRDITLTGLGLQTDTTAKSTIIDGGQSGSVVTFFGTESPKCILNNFEITNGYAARGGGIRGNRCRALIRNNRISANTVQPFVEDNDDCVGAGIYKCNGIIECNEISRNTAGYYDYHTGSVSGLECSMGIVRYNLIHDNIARSAVVFDGSYSLIYNNRIYRNNQFFGSCSFTQSIFMNNALYEENLIEHVPIFATNSIIANSIFYSNDSWGFDWTNPLLGSVWVNCIIDAQSIDTCVLEDDSVKIMYSCIENWSKGGQGNISKDPLFIDPGNGDFRLNSDSPCIDAGMMIEGWSVDGFGGFRPINGTDEPRGDGSDYDMGAYEYERK